MLKLCPQQTLHSVKSTVKANQSKYLKWPSGGFENQLVQRNHCYLFSSFSSVYEVSRTECHRSNLLQVCSATSLTPSFKARIVTLGAGSECEACKGLQRLLAGTERSTEHLKEGKDGEGYLLPSDLVPTKLSRFLYYYCYC